MRRRRVLVAAAAVLVPGGLGAGGPAVPGLGTPAASAAEPSSPGCAWHLVAGPLLGAAGSRFLVTHAVPADPSQDCTDVVTATGRLVPAAGGQYGDVTSTPSEIQLRFLPGLPTPEVDLDWAGHCADPASPGVLSLAVGAQVVSVPVPAESCSLGPAPSATLAAGVNLPTAVAVARSGHAGGYQVLVDQRVDLLGAGGSSDPYAGAPRPDATADALAATSTGGGAWVAGADGGVFAYGDAPFEGSAYPLALTQPIVGMAATPDDRGYWLVAADGGVFSFGDAAFHGSLGGVHLAAPVVGMAATPDGLGYWLVAADGGVFSFGDAAFHGSAAGIHLAAPVVGMAADPATGGYWLAGADGGVFGFGAPYDGSAVGYHPVQPVVSIAATADGGGYWMAAGDLGVFAFGDAPYLGH